MDDFVKIMEQYIKDSSGIAYVIEHMSMENQDALYAPPNNDSLFYISLAQNEYQEMDGVISTTVVFRISREHDGHNPRYVRVVGVVDDAYRWYDIQWGILHEVKAVERMVTFYESLDAPA